MSFYEIYQVGNKYLDQTMLRFNDISQKNPDKRNSKARIEDYQEIENPLETNTLKEQASRCSQCGIPMCSVGCPLTNQIPEWLSAAAEGRMKDAYMLSSSTNTFPEICGRICPQDRLCEGSCVVKKDFGSVTIESIEKNITDTAWENGWVEGPRPSKERPEKIAIIGSGPAGLAAADQLRAYGYQVDILDRQERFGGLLMYGIPNFKLEKEIVLKRVKLLEQSGVNFVKKTVGSDISFAQLRNRYEAILICTGVYKARQLVGPKFPKRSTIPALPFLKLHNQMNLGDINEASFPAEYNPKGKRILVIGGGDTAMDCIRTSLRAGASSVTCVYRRDASNMPGSKKEVEHATEEGAQFEWLLAPVSVEKLHKGYQVKFAQMKLGFTTYGRRPVEIVPGAYKTFEADIIIESLGFEPEDMKELFPHSGIILNPNGTIETDFKSMKTSVDGVFAAGDIVRGASLVVWAIRDGRTAAKSIHKSLSSKK